MGTNDDSLIWEWEARARADVARLRDALDHIMRVAREGIQPTKRLDWVEQRARYALEGKEWIPGIVDHPKNHRTEIARRDQRMRAAIRDITSDEWWSRQPVHLGIGELIKERLAEKEEEPA